MSDVQERAPMTKENDPQAYIAWLKDYVATLEAERDAWIESARQFARNETYYRGLVVQIGAALGKAAYTADDGSISQDVLCAKVPELVVAQAAELAALRKVAVPEDEAMVELATVAWWEAFAPNAPWEVVGPKLKEANRQYIRATIRAINAALSGPGVEGGTNG